MKRGWIVGILQPWCQGPSFFTMAMNGHNHHISHKIHFLGILPGVSFAQGTEQISHPGVLQPIQRCLISLHAQSINMDK